jgi:mono/diheme cytochrome c family protein
MSVLPPTARLFKKHVFRIILLVILIFAIVVGWIVYDRFFRTVAQPFEAGSEQAFKYGSIGVEEESGIPYWIWLVLPRVFPEHLPGPGGYASLGMVWEQGEEMPVGFSKKRIGYERVAFNCALCHSATYRIEGSDGRPGKTVVVPGGPAIRLDPQAYLAFLGRCANDPRFNPDTILEAIEYNIELSALDRALYRHLLIPATRKAILAQSEESNWMRSRPLWGHGRIDPFNPVKFGMLEMDPDPTVGNSDMMPLWELENRQAEDKSWNLHWDGLSTNPVHSSLAGALGDGASRKSIPEDDIKKLVAAFKGETKPQLFRAPKYPFAPNPGDPKVVSGKDIFNNNCAICHALEEKFTNQVIRVGDEGPPNNVAAYYGSGKTPFIETDTNRLSMWNPVQLGDPLNPDDDRHPATRYNQFAKGYLPTFVGTTGYVAVPLNGIWLRSPYLHNGSVPTLEDLLNPPLSEEEVQELIDTINKIIIAKGRPTVDYKQLVERFNQIGDSESPPELASAQLKRLAPFVDLVIKTTREKGKRPPMFYRGSDILHPKWVGFKHDSSTTSERFLPVPYITSVRGNSNQGHLWGTNLDTDEKEKLVEYLKTL